MYTVLQAQGNIYMLVGPGGNTTVQVGKDGILLVDTQYAEVAPKILAEIKKLNPGELRYIIDTSADLDQMGGNELLRKAGSTIAGGAVARATSGKPPAVEVAQPSSPARKRSQSHERADRQTSIDSNRRVAHRYLLRR